MIMFNNIPSIDSVTMSNNISKTDDLLYISQGS